jgi:hypothetical protein
MTFGLLNVALLLGLAGLAIPPIIHLLHRRRFEVIDWGAMQFLQISETTRRRLLLEEILLMLLRMGLIGVVVLALAAPFVISAPLAKILGDRPNRDVVLIFDGSASMGYVGEDKTPHEAAQEWARGLVDELAPSDSVAVLLARQQVVPVLPEPTHDLRLVREQIARLPSPNGSCDLPEAVREALRILNETSHRPEREIIILSDGQRFGWADENSLSRWKLLASLLHDGTAVPPRIWVVNLDTERPAHPPNWTLAPIRTGRNSAHIREEIKFRSDLVLFGQEKYTPPHRIQLEIDGHKKDSDLGIPKTAQAISSPPEVGKEKASADPVDEWAMKRVPLRFQHQFEKPGSHLISVIVEPDPPSENHGTRRQPKNRRVKDVLPIDNRRDFAVEALPPIPVLLVDGEPRLRSPFPNSNPRKRGTDFIRDALSPDLDPTPEIRVRVVPLKEFEADVLDRDVGPEAGSKPRVLVLSNVAQLSATQQESINQFLAAGGGLLVTLGSEVDERHYNEQLYRNGEGWLPARLEQVASAGAGGEAPLGGRPANPLPVNFSHPVLERFRADPSGFAKAEFQRWWKVSPAAGSVTAARLTGQDPLLVEGPARPGRVLLCTVPLNPSWDTNFLGMAEFPVLAHEIVHYLAGLREGDYGSRSAEYNLRQGQPIRFRLEGESWNDLTLQRPGEEPLPMVFEGPRRPGVHRGQLLLTERSGTPGNHPVVVYPETHAAGVYRLRTGEGRIYYYVVQPEVEESNLEPCREQDWVKVREFLPMTYVTERDPRQSPLATELHTQELWWWLLVGVIGLLCGELWMTRRIARGR